MIQFFLLIKDIFKSDSLFSFLDFILSFLFLSLLLASIFLGYSISENKKIEENKLFLINIYMIIGIIIIVLFKVFLNEEFQFIHKLLSIQITNILLLTVLLYLYFFFPTKKLLGIGRLVLFVLMLLLVMQVLMELDLFSNLNNNFWPIVNNISSIIQILGFLFFSGSVLNLLTKRKNTIDSIVFSDLVKNAANEILSWSNNNELCSKYQSYWNASNVYFQNGFYYDGIDILKKGLTKRRWSYYDEAILKYQIACGYSLLNNK